MVCNSELKNGSDLNEFKIPESCKSEFKIPESCTSDDGLYVNSEFYVKYGGVDGSSDGSELRALFDQVVSCFLKRVSSNNNGFRPFPPKIGDGMEVDLFKLFLTIRKIGSYELVSKKNLWEFVARECGLEIELVASLKLVYVKYLKEFNKWLLKRGFKDEKMENVEVGVIEKLDKWSRQLEKSLIGVEVVEFDNSIKKNAGTLGFNQTEGVTKNLDFTRMSDDDEKFSDKRCELSPKVIKKVGFSMVDDEVKRNDLSSDNVVKKVALFHDNDIEDSEYDDKQIELSIKNVVSEVLRFHSDNDEMLTTMDDDRDNLVSHNANNVEKVVNCQKRKREEEYLPLLEMLDWIQNTARDPHDRAFETSQRRCKWKNYTSDKLWKQALLSRRALFAELNVDSANEACSSQKKNQKMHPSMYEDELNNARSSRRTASVIPCSSRIKRQRTEPGKTQSDRIHEITEPQDKECKVGRLYQAEVPLWTGVVSDSDPKWLGTQMWPPPDDEPEKSTMVIGLGRESSCECVFRGSVECVRFHIAENRLKVKLELGQLFYKWKFNQMGEEISLAWELEEEKRFKSLVIRARNDLSHSTKSRREIMNMFWRKASSLIPAKLKQNLVSYYFNVFVIRRRSYQNRVTPTEIDSDNDEEEVGSVGDRFGYEKVNGMLLKCSENLQCTELES